MDRRRDLANDEIHELAKLLAALPRVQSPDDVDGLPADSVGVSAVGLTNELLGIIAARAPHIRYLETDGNARVSDVGLPALGRFTRLEWLSLEWSAISDAGLTHVAGVRTLRWVEVGGSTGLTRDGVAWLRRIRPDLEVEAHGW